MRDRFTRRGLRWSVRTRILAAILTVTAIGMAAAGTTAYFVQRDRILQEVDEKLLHSLDSVRAVVLGSESDADADSAEESTEPQEPQETAIEAPPAPEFENPEAVLQAVLARVLPDGNESSLGLINDIP